MSPAIEEGPRGAPPAGHVACGSAFPAYRSFLQSAVGTAEGMIRLADEKVGYMLLFLGILAAVLSLRADMLLSLLVGPGQPLALRALLVAGGVLFLGAASMSLVYAVRSRALAADFPGDVSSMLSHLASLEMEGLLEGLARALYQRAEIAQQKLALLRKCLAWAAVSLTGWVWVLLISLVP